MGKVTAMEGVQQYLINWANFANNFRSHIPVYEDKYHFY